MQKIVEMSSISISMFEKAIESLFQCDFDLAESVIEKTREVMLIEKEAVAATQHIGADEAANIRLIIESIRRTAEYASDIAEIVLNMTVESAMKQQFQKK